MRYIPHTSDEVARMLATIGVDDVDALFDTIPEALQLGRALSVPSAMSERDLLMHMADLAGQNKHTEEAVSFLGSDVPVMCTWRKMTGIPCMGCGLTRSLTFMAHGQPWMALQMNLLGPILFSIVAFQIPWRAFKLWQGRPPPAQPTPA